MTLNSVPLYRIVLPDHIVTLMERFLSMMMMADPLMKLRLNICPLSQRISQKCSMK